MSHPAQFAQAVNIVAIPFEELLIFGEEFGGGVLHDQFAQIDVVDDFLRNAGQEGIDSIRHDAGSWFVDIMFRFVQERRKYRCRALRDDR
ncbi:hypothetical protein D3C84_972890 [compost metagenome]